MPPRVDVRLFAILWYYDKYMNTRRLVDSNWTRKLLSIHGTVKAVVNWLHKKHNELVTNGVIKNDRVCESTPRI